MIHPTRFCLLHEFDLKFKKLFVIKNGNPVGSRMKILSLYCAGAEDWSDTQ